MTAFAPGLFDALSLAVTEVDDVVVRTVRDVHFACSDRAHSLTRRPTGGMSVLPEAMAMHRGIAASVYSGIGLGLRGVATVLDRAGSAGHGPRLETSPAGARVNAVANGLVGDLLGAQGSRLAIPMAVRAARADVPLTTAGLAAAHPDASGMVAVLLHGWCEDDTSWHRGGEHAATYLDTLTRLGWTPVVLRANTGLPVRENGIALTALLQDLVASWPVEVRRITLIGHSMGGLIMRAAAAASIERSWAPLVTDVITLGTPHRGSPVAQGVSAAGRRLALLPETAPFGRILDHRSRGVEDLVAGLGCEIPPLPHARYRLVAATLSSSPQHPVGHVVGDLLVRVPSAYGRARCGPDVFSGADTLHLGRADHFDLLNHPQVHDALEKWLA